MQDCFEEQGELLQGDVHQLPCKETHAHVYRHGHLPAGAAAPKRFRVPVRACSRPGDPGVQLGRRKPAFSQNTRVATVTCVSYSQTASGLTVGRQLWNVPAFVVKSVSI